MTGQLTDEQWDLIIAAAMENLKGPKAMPEDADVFGEELSDFELEDGDYDTDSDGNADTEGEDDAFEDMDKQDPYQWNNGYTGSDMEEEIDQLEED
jgi:hypothetical protein